MEVNYPQFPKDATITTTSDSASDTTDTIYVGSASNTVTINDDILDALKHISNWSPTEPADSASRRDPLTYVNERIVSAAKALENLNKLQQNLVNKKFSVGDAVFARGLGNCLVHDLVLGTDALLNNVDLQEDEFAYVLLDSHGNRHHRRENQVKPYGKATKTLYGDNKS